MKEISVMDASTMSDKLGELYRELSIERAAARGLGAKANTGRIRELKRTIARLFTVATQKKMTIAVKLGKPPAAKVVAQKPKADAKKAEQKSATPKPGMKVEQKHVPKPAQQAKPASKPSDDFSAMVGEVKKE
jgi:large subunit ribosomal protein L29